MFDGVMLLWWILTIPSLLFVVIDVIDPVVGSLAALGVPPGIVRVTVTD